MITVLIFGMHELLAGFRTGRVCLINALIWNVKN